MPKPKTAKNTSRAPDSDLLMPSADQLLQDWNAQAHKERNNWLSKPRLHLGIFEELAEAERIAASPQKALATPELKRIINRQTRERELRAKETVRPLGWSAKRFNAFKKLAFEYRNDPSITHYLAIRTHFPELDIQIAMSAGIDPLFAAESTCLRYDIDPGLVAGAMDGFEPGIDALCLLLMERIIARNKIRGVGAVQKRRTMISDAFVNYLIAFMLEGFDWIDDEVRMPASLILLIRHQLGPLIGDFHKEYESREAKLQAAWLAGQQLQPNQKLSINLLIKFASAGDRQIARSTAARWLKDAEFQRRLKFSQEYKASPEKFDLKRP